MNGYATRIRIRQASHNPAVRQLDQRARNRRDSAAIFAISAGVIGVFLLAQLISQVMP